jgi:nucleotide-binding universal stress UspA family protein
MFDRVALGFDASSHSRRASRVAVGIVESFRSELTILLWRPRAETSESAELEDLVPVSETGKPRASLLEEVRGAALAAGARGVHVVAIEHDVLDSMLVWLGEHPQDLMIVGSQGQSRGRRLLMGSLSTGLVAGAPCPVLVVRGTMRSSGAVHPAR